MTKLGRIALDAHSRAAAGVAPPDAWKEALRAVYSGRQLQNQLQHTCPKWAFSGLCQDGELTGVPAGRAPVALERESARYAREVLRALREEPGLAADKPMLKRRIFGKQGEDGYRTPNDEVEVVLALWDSGLVRERRADADAGERPTSTGRIL